MDVFDYIDAIVPRNTARRGDLAHLARAVGVNGIKIAATRDGDELTTMIADQIVPSDTVYGRALSDIHVDKGPYAWSVFTTEPYPGFAEHPDALGGTKTMLLTLPYTFGYGVAWMQLAQQTQGTHALRALRICLTRAPLTTTEKARLQIDHDLDEYPDLTRDTPNTPKMTRLERIALENAQKAERLRRQEAELAAREERVRERDARLRDLEHRTTAASRGTPAEEVVLEEGDATVQRKVRL